MVRMDETIVRESGAAGEFYPADSMMLESELSLLLEAALPLDLPRPPRTLIVPHAPYAYAGGVAARAYRQLFDQSIKRVVILAPGNFDKPETVSIFSGKAYQTVLGSVPIDQDLSRTLSGFDSALQLSTEGHSSGESAIEVQLPFLQWILGKFSLIAITMGQPVRGVVDILWKGLSELLPPAGSLIVACSNLSRSRPDAEARLLDQVARRDIEQFDETRLWEDVEQGLAEMSGCAGVVAGLRTARAMDANTAKVLLYRNSGDITRDRQKVEGYLAAVVY